MKSYDATATMPDLGPSFSQFAAGLKERAERGA